MTALRFAFLLAAGLAALQAAAQDAQPASSFALGGGIGLRPSVYEGDDDRFRAIPLVSFRNQWFSIAGTTADLSLLRGQSWSLGLRAHYALGDGYDAGDSPVFTGMPDRKESLWLGVAGQWDASFARLGFSWLADASGRSDGQRVRVGLDRDFAQGSWRFTPRVAATWQSEKAVDYYYGVASRYATPDRPAYRPDAGLTTELGLRVAYGLDRHQSVFMDLSATHLGSEIADSPLVDRSWVPALGLGYLYRF